MPVVIVVTLRFDQRIETEDRRKAVTSIRQRTVTITVHEAARTFTVI